MTTTQPTATLGRTYTFTDHRHDTPGWEAGTIHATARLEHHDDGDGHTWAWLTLTATTTPDLGAADLTLTPTQARNLARYLVAAADAAEQAR